MRESAVCMYVDVMLKWSFKKQNETVVSNFASKLKKGTVGVVARLGGSSVTVTLSASDLVF